MSPSQTQAPGEQEPWRDLYALLRDAWLTPQGEATSKASLRSAVHEFFERSRQTFDREEYSGIVKNGLHEFIKSSFFDRFPGLFDLCAVEYRSLAPRIVGETPAPESLLLLFGSGAISREELEVVDRVMRAAYGRELTYLSLIPEDFGWLQVVFHRTGSELDPVRDLKTVDLSIEDELHWLMQTHGKAWYDAYLDEGSQREIKEEIHRRVKGTVLQSLEAQGVGLEGVGASDGPRERLAEMVVSTPFMTLTRMTQTEDKKRSILYLPAHLHGERLGGAVLLGPRRVESRDLLEALYITLQLLLSHLRLLEFPEEVRSAERDVLLRELVLRFRHNMMHPLGNLMDAARRFEDSFRQLLVTFERGIDEWKPDLMPNPLLTFLNYIAEEYRAEGQALEHDEDDRKMEDDLFPIDVKGMDRIEHFDRSILAEVFRNLMSNTSRYALGKGLKRVEIDAGESGPRITYREVGGPGLPPDIAANPWRLHARDPADEESSGKGLFLAKKLMGIHEGDITYERDASGGCKFLVDLRREEGPSNGEEPQNHDY